MKDPGSTPRARARLLPLLAALVLTACSENEKYDKFVAIGDSLAEGYQSGTCFYATQTNSWPVFVAHQVMEDADEDFKPPLLTLPVPNDAARRRMDPTHRTLNLGVGGARVHDALHTEATATSPTGLVTEYDRVLYPRTGTQLEAAEAEDADLIIFWMAGNDTLGSVTRVGQIDGVSGLTPIEEFRADFTEVARRLGDTGADVVVGTIVPVTYIPYNMPGPIFGLPAGTWVPLPLGLGILGGTVDPAALTVPGNILTLDEVALIQAHTQQLNEIIKAQAAANGLEVFDAYAFLNGVLAQQPITIPGSNFRVSAHYAPVFSPTGTSGLVSLDGVHASNTGYALVANEFIKVVNTRFDKDFDLIDVAGIAAQDPYVDNDGDGCIEGPGFFPRLAGIIGDSNDFSPAVNECRGGSGKLLPHVVDPLARRFPMGSPLIPGAWDGFLGKR